MAERRCRPFTLIDAMILVAAVGVAIRWLKPNHSSSFWFLDNAYRALFGRDMRVLDRIVTGLGRIRAVSPLLACCSVAALVLRLRRPRPAFPRLARQPGFVFPLTISVALAVEALQSLVYGAWVSRGGGREFSEAFLDALDTTTGTCQAVLAVATLMTVGRMWRPERGWLDNLGWCLALWWVLERVLYLVQISLIVWFD